VPLPSARLRQNIQWASVKTATKCETTSASPAVWLKTPVGGVASENANAIGSPSPVDSTLRWGSWQMYDGIAVERLDNRYYFSNWGRFTSPDRSGRSINLRNPQSWNRYIYI